MTGADPKEMLKELVERFQNLSEAWDSLNPGARYDELRHLVEHLTLLERKEFRKAKEEEEKRWVRIYWCVHCKRHFMAPREEKVERCPYCDFGGPLYESGLAEMKELPSTGGKAVLAEPSTEVAKEEVKENG
jgi:DNA-directed RNA polymerase subunit RPC12/RpoP